jgi:tetratricopeptide (TPR) repeat protein
VPFLAALAVLIVLCNWPTGLDDGRVAEQTEMLVFLASDGREQDVTRLLPQTEAAHRDPALLLSRVAAALQSSGRTAAAVPLLERARRADPGRADVALALGQALLEVGRAADAVAPLRAAVEGGVPTDVGRFELARALAASGRREEARAVLNDVAVAQLEAGPANAVARLALELDDVALAERSASRAVAVAPSVARARETLGLVLARLGRVDEAIVELEVACRLDSGSASAHLNLAVLLAESSRMAEARARAEQALRIQPDYDRARQFLAALPTRPD